MSGTISNTITSGITLSVNPTTITATGAVNTTAGNAVYGADGTVWTLINSGSVSATGIDAIGVTFAGAGSVTNAAPAIISAMYGITIAGALQVNNYGSIAGRYAVQGSGAAGTVRNDGSIYGSSEAISLALGGAVTNASGGGIYGAGYAIDIKGAAGSLVNSGTVSAHGTAAVLFAGGGAINNLAGGTIAGGFGVTVSGAVGTVSNAGTISGAYFSGSFIGQTLGGFGIALAGGGSVTNASGGMISGPDDGVSIAAGGTVTNASLATITGGQAAIAIVGGGDVVNNGALNGTGFRGVYLTDGGTVINNSGASIAAYSTDVSISGTGGVVMNAGTMSVSGSNGVGILMSGGGSVNNAAGGVIAGHLRGVDMFGGGTLVNGGLISSTIVAARYGAVYMNAGSTDPSSTVTNLSTGTIAGVGRAIYQAFKVGTVINAGTIIGTNVAGIEMVAGGSITAAAVVNNQAGGSVTGLFDGIYVYRTSSTITNAGSIVGTGTSAAGMFLRDGGSVSNLAGGAILAVNGSINRGIAIAGATGTIANAGTIGGSGFGVYLGSGGTVVNAAGGSIHGGYGVSIGGGGTVTNAGTIAGSGADAVAFAPGHSNRLIADPGAIFTGAVNGGNTVGAAAVTTLELAGGATGTLAGVGTTFTNFSAIAFDPGADWSVAGSVAGLASGQTISGFAAGDALVLTGLNETVQSFTNNTLSLTGDQAVSLIVPGNFTTGSFHTASADGGTSITVACFAEGTHIRTPGGEVAVERLLVGDAVLSTFGGMVPVQWMGQRRIDCRRHPQPRDVMPVRVRANAFAPGVPSRDLLLSPDHAVLCDGHLIPVRYLVNGATIAQDEVDTVTYWHVELPAHDVIFAENLACESYLDTGNRAAFANAGTTIMAHADFGVWETESCAPLAADANNASAAN
jgi:hypothetical protein